jgi:hypothetical protein
MLLGMRRSLHSPIGNVISKKRRFATIKSLSPDKETPKKSSLKRRRSNVAIN